ncbi:MAG: chorismate synthase [Ignavibacteria bacterium RIFOXYB2_FULL_35_12]|nr:MAG: chorismate synthase [Ignavibacteria bacterium GWA2_36_19]OGU55311.1 MAG: chorismate synthase [Ignavibacteria bacterium GWC2_35_8]OGU59298.1 MAG: chorismate synthase [Ignavibacteria bacterium GWF2_35_20]OGU78359.1 MAG: chorismate synthase [Ignavibacteria bacterium RIFOXYA2_FULL_35_9]OGU84477.1 MAG: chorismate synthase [Ignavibacteria bacterium RBG_16_35_7]OGU86509.1 MAG: chorismate synthase [Ignavibacteria bacterium RIFOXYA12_FULL_35_25]OGU86869.1 MAG: chorismate synthase [Ignavibacter
MVRFLTSGESHGKSLATIVEGFPSNIKLRKDYIDFHLKRRQAGYGRGQRMKIESDSVEIISGIRFGKSLGSPICLLIKNNDWENWIAIMSSEIPSSSFVYDKISIPRPGHADLVGISKYNYDDIRNSIERSSARETASRVAAGTVARKFLEEFGITIGSYVESISGIYSKKNYLQNLLMNKTSRNFSAWRIAESADKSDVRVLDNNQEERIIRKIKYAKKNGDTLGGTFVTIATGVPVGLGSFMHYDRRLDAAIGHSIMSINAVKGVEIGNGFDAAEKFGSQVHDEIFIKDNIFTRKTNRSGGIEGGVSTGLPIIVRASMKPISTLMKPLQTIDLKTMKKVEARRERSDFVAVPACAVISESMLAWILAEFFIEKFGGDSIEETKDNFSNYTKKLQKRIAKNFSGWYKDF